jgi:citrate lyase beta subunit
MQEGNARMTIAIRANHPSTADFSKDILTIKQLATSYELYALLLPKTSSASDLQNTKEALSEIGHAQIKIIPIIENERGLENIQEISEAAAEMGNEHICYGHYDYHLDAGSWPFPSIHDPKFWETAQVVIEQAMKAGLIYIQPPFAELHNSVTLADIINHLVHHCEDRFHVLSAGPSQTPILTKLVSATTRRSNSTPITTSHSRELSSKEKDELAKDIQKAFGQSKRSQHSFTTDASANRFITPHEYAAALRYIKQREHA